MKANFGEIGKGVDLLLLVLVHDLELRVDDIALVLSRTILPFTLRLTLGACACSCAGSGRLFVKFFADALELILKVVVGDFDRVGVAAFEGFADGFDLSLDFLLLVLGDLIAQLLELLLALLGKVVGVIADFDSFLRLLVFLGVGFGVALHLLDLFLTQS